MGWQSITCEYSSENRLLFKQILPPFCAVDHNSWVAYTLLLRLTRPLCLVASPFSFQHAYRRHRALVDETPVRMGSTVLGGSDDGVRWRRAEQSILLFVTVLQVVDGGDRKNHINDQASSANAIAEDITGRAVVNVGAHDGTALSSDEEEQ